MNMENSPNPTPRHERLAVAFDAVIVADGKTINCRILNISAGGAQLMVDRKFSHG